MPSGVSHGSALAAGIAAATGWKATSAKLGMRVIPWLPQACDCVRSVAVDSSRRHCGGRRRQEGASMPRRISEEEIRGEFATWANPSMIGAGDKAALHCQS
ncbi:hypothetical protein chiPu_0033431 [Chiloscyllium punctatum]|uniref:Uncharacterized protein n=1 Tax=Chiloscyllium punctatum TaxID=137246 RepID=A0A401U3I8_CHIPU|nr:hypothetical protein [Chiloscyllium punctatum]